MNQKQAKKTEAIDALLRMLKPGDTVCGIVRTVSRSGMSQTIDFYTQKDMAYLSVYMSDAMDLRRAPNGALKIVGCGMDMVFKTVYDLGAVLWPNGTPEPHGTRNGEPDSEGGYALKSRRL